MFGIAAGIGLAISYWTAISVFAALGSVSVGALFTAGIVPGLLMAAALMIVVHWQAVSRKFEPAKQAATLRERESVWNVNLPGHPPRDLRHAFRGEPEMFEDRGCRC